MLNLEIDLRVYNRKNQGRRKKVCKFDYQHCKETTGAKEDNIIAIYHYNITFISKLAIPSHNLISHNWSFTSHN